MRFSSEVLARASCVVGFVAALGLAGVASAQNKPPPEVAIKTSVGTIVVVLDPAAAPVTVANFLSYVRAGKYNGTIFHRVIDGFMIQGGGFDPDLHERSAGSPIKNEAKNGLKNKTGTIAMARTSEIDSATTEFFINVADNGFLDHLEVPPGGIDVTRHEKTRHVDPADANSVYGYAVFGHVVKGMDVVERIAKMQTKTVGEYENVPVNPVVIHSVTVLS
jgi:cyclophilin family peptidyl-prolyl cis-trans isomerase